MDPGEQEMWPMGKALAAMNEPHNESTRGLAVVLTTGGMNPLHRGHVALLHQATAALTEVGYQVLGAWLSPSHDRYLQPKAKHLSTIGLSAAFRLEAARRTLQSDPLVEVGYWESAQPGSWPDYPQVCKALSVHLEAQALPGPVTVFYACGTDHALKCGLYRGMGSFGCVIVPREGETAGKSCPERQVYVAQPAHGEVASFSSTKVREALACNNSDYVGTALSPEAAQFLLLSLIHISEPTRPY
eukprot:TRINITY_DN4276_c0_g1_i2.p1 TRINITY_DN4276_c0_g1~~TRINITY_DN4276_c0_g1_i2.p1  ORF type:complete len:244 (-),score=37.24 TRINITY_DN4276_c0_g1_i2:89-820(-)